MIYEYTHQTQLDVEAPRSGLPLSYTRVQHQRTWKKNFKVKFTSYFKRGRKMGKN